MFNRRDRQFEQQFRWEEDRWVFRYHQGGLPVVVTDEERRQLVVEHARRTKMAKRMTLGALIALSLLMSPMIAIGVPRSILLVALVVVPVSIRLALGHWAGKLLTRPLRSRRVVGERLGLLGRFKMRAETSRWQDLWLQAALVMLYLFAMPFRQSVPMRLLIAAGAVLVVSRILIKWAGEQRSRRGARWSGLARRAQHLADEGENGGR